MARKCSTGVASPPNACRASEPLKVADWTAEVLPRCIRSRGGTCATAVRSDARRRRRRPEKWQARNSQVLPK